MPKPELDLVGSDEASTICGVDRATFLRWREDGLITEAGKLPGSNGAYMFHRADVEKLAANRSRVA